jgi:hypothetical protein
MSPWELPKNYFQNNGNDNAIPGNDGQLRPIARILPYEMNARKMQRSTVDAGLDRILNVRITVLPAALAQDRIRRQLDLQTAERLQAKHPRST